MLQNSSKKMSLKLINLKATGFLLGVALAVSACSGSSGVDGSGVEDYINDGTTYSSSSGTTGSGTTASILGNVVSYINKGPVTGATCYLYNVANQIIGGPVTSANGVASFSGISVPPNNGLVMVNCIGGTYTDEATGGSKTAPSLRGVANAASATAATVVVTPFTEMAVRKSADDFSDYFEQAANVANALGIPDTDITSTRPTDLNTATAGDNDAGRYGTALAGLSQLIDDGGAGSSLTSALTTLTAAITDADLSTTQNANFREALSELQNSAVKENLLADVTEDQFDNLADTITTPYVNSSSISVTPAAPIVYGTNVTFSGDGGNLSDSVITAALSNSGTCESVNIINSSSFTVNCLAPDSGSATTFKLLAEDADVADSSVTVEGSSVNYSLAAESSAPNSAAVLAEVLPVLANYSVTNQNFNVCGDNIPTTASATLGGRNCAKIAYDANVNPCSASDSSKETYTCATPTVDTPNGETFALNVGGTYTLDKTVAYTNDATITDVSPDPIPGSVAPASWAITGTKLYDGLTFTFNGHSCGMPTSVNSAGTEAIIDCSAVTVPEGQASADLVASDGSVSSTLNLSWAYLGSVTPEASDYAAENDYIVSGANFGTGVSATLGGRACSTTSGKTNTASTLYFTCTATDDRNETAETLALVIPGANRTLSQSIMLSALPVTLTSANPDQIEHGLAGSSDWQVNGTGLHTGMEFSFNNTACNSHGNVLSETQIINIDCSNANAASSGESTALSATGVRVSGSISSLAITAANISTVSPGVVQYGSENEFTITGVNMPTNARAWLGSNACIAGTSQSSTSLTYTCNAQTERETDNQTQLLVDFDGASNEFRNISLESPSISLTSVVPSTLAQGAVAPTNWAVTGVGLHSGLVFSFNGSNCTISSVFANGTQANIDCSSVTAPDIGTSTLLSATDSNSHLTINSLPISLSTLPVAMLQWSGFSSANNINISANGTSITGSAEVVSPATCSGATVTYSATIPTSDVATFSTSNSSFTVISGSALGVATVKATSTAVAGLCAAGEIIVNFIVVNQPVVNVTLNVSDENVVFGEVASNTRTATSTTIGAGITYSLDPSSSPSDVATVNSTTGVVTILKSGTAVITATGTAADYSDGSASYNLIIAKGNVEFTPAVTASNEMEIGTSDNIDRSVVITNSGVNTAATAPTGIVDYSIVDGSSNLPASLGSATISNGGLVTPTEAGEVQEVVTYPGDDNYNALTETYSVTINKGSSGLINVAWTTSPATVTYPNTQTVEALASRTGTGPDLVNNIEYSSSEPTIATVNADTGVVTPVTGGNVNIIATFTGDDSYNSGSNSSQTILIVKANPTVSIGAGLTDTLQAVQGSTQTETVTVTVNSVTGGVPPTGTVTFSLVSAVTGVTLTNGSNSCDNVALNTSQVATCTINIADTTLDDSNIVLTAEYNGDDRYNVLDDTHTFTSVIQAVPVISWFNGNTPIDTNNNVEISLSAAAPSITYRVSGTPSVNNSAPTGTVVFSASATGVVSLCSTTAVNFSDKVYSTTEVYTEWTCVLTPTGVSNNTIVITANFTSGNGAYVNNSGNITILLIP